MALAQLLALASRAEKFGPCAQENDTALLLRDGPKVMTQPLRMAGSGWSPGYSCLYALAWPAELSTNASWRAVITVQRETEGFRRWVNDRFRREVFNLPLYGKHAIYSEVVDASAPFAMPK